MFNYEGANLLWTANQSSKFSLGGNRTAAFKSKPECSVAWACLCRLYRNVPTGNFFLVEMSANLTKNSEYIKFFQTNFQRIPEPELRPPMLIHCLFSSITQDLFNCYSNITYFVTDFSFLEKNASCETLDIKMNTIILGIYRKSNCVWVYFTKIYEWTNLILVHLQKIQETRHSG